MRVTVGLKIIKTFISIESIVKICIPVSILNFWVQDIEILLSDQIVLTIFKLTEHENR